MELNEFFELEKEKQIEFLVELNEKECNEYLDRVKKVDRAKFRRISGTVSSQRQQKSIFKEDFSQKNIENIQSHLPVEEINIFDIELNPYQPRKHFDEEKLNDLANSIATNGQLQNILVSKDTNTNKIILIAGERRLRAAIINYKKTNNDKYKKILANTLKDVSIRDLKIFAVTENANREPMTLLENAMACKSLSDENLSLEKIKEVTSISTTSIQRLLKIADLPDELKTIIVANKLYSESKIFQLTRLDNIGDQLEIIELINKNINRDKLVKLVSEYISGDIVKKPIKNLSTKKIAISDLDKIKNDYSDFTSRYESLSNNNKDKATEIFHKIQKLQTQLLKLD